MKITQIKYWQVLIVFALTILLFSSSYAQREQWYGALTYSVSVPSGDTKEIIEDIGWWGMGLDYRYMVQKNLSVGLYFGWNTMYERVTGLTELNTDPPGAIYGTQDNTINSFPIMASIHYYFGERKQLRPYIGLNAGGSIMLQEKAIGIFLWQNDQWQWGIAPEAGVAIPVERDFGLLINGKYNMYFSGEDAIGNDINHSYWAINVGFIWEP